ncbi:anti-sigma factor [Microbacterium sp. NPDC076911]|uniref:anti-sigma factor n=1 Tax=Microbacterium sp. NPDC076911 TaxID=3154958 RepID=UPI00343C9967
MSHLDPEQLALLALGEPAASVTDCAHLSSCEPCRTELGELSRAVGVARATVADEKLEAPPARVWSAIAGELDLKTSHASVAPETRATLEANPPEHENAPDEQAQPPAHRSRSLRATVWALAASLVVIGGIGIGALAVSTNVPTSIAQAVLEPFPDHPGATGMADVEEDSDGVRRLIVSVGDEVAPDTYREVWLIRNDAAALVSLGVLEGETGSFVIPEGLDLVEYSLVDVSVEPLDGDPAHSGDSIVRGELSRT